VYCSCLILEAKIHPETPKEILLMDACPTCDSSCNSNFAAVILFQRTRMYLPVVENVVSLKYYIVRAYYTTRLDISRKLQGMSSKIILSSKR